jgi:hypothetical protein
MAGTIKIVNAMLDSFIETYEKQDQLLDLVTVEKPAPAEMQNADNVLWKPVEQHAPVLEGWDLTGTTTDIIEEGCPFLLGTPINDRVTQRIDQMRDMRYWERRAEVAAYRLAAKLNTDLATALAQQGSLHIRTNATSGYDMVGEAQAVMNERQLYKSNRCFVFNDRDNLKAAEDLAGRQTLQGRPEQVWNSGQVAQNVAEFDVYTGSYLINQAGGTDPATTTTANVSEKPLPGTVVNNSIVTNYDYRIATIPVTASASYNLGDKVTFANSGTTVKALGLHDKVDTNQAMTFTIVEIVDGTNVKVFPKPIAADDAALSTLEKAYANIDTQILSGATMNRVNIDTNAKTNLFFDKSAITVLAGEVPWEKIKEWAGKKIVTDTLKNGVNVYILYDGDIITANFDYRIFLWYGVTVNNPSNAGILTTYT